MSHEDLKKHRGFPVEKKKATCNRFQNHSRCEKKKNKGTCPGSNPCLSRQSKLPQKPQSSTTTDDKIDETSMPMPPR